MDTLRGLDAILAIWALVGANAFVAFMGRDANAGTQSMSKQIESRRTFMVLGVRPRLLLLLRAS